MFATRDHRRELGARCDRGRWACKASVGGRQFQGDTRSEVAEVHGARVNNLQNLSVDLPLGEFVALTVREPFLPDKTERTFTVGTRRRLVGQHDASIDGLTEERDDRPTIPPIPPGFSR